MPIVIITKVNINFQKTKFLELKVMSSEKAVSEILREEILETFAAICQIKAYLATKNVSITYHQIIATM